MQDRAMLNPARIRMLLTMSSQYFVQIQKSIISKLSLATQSRSSPSFGVYPVCLIAVGYFNQPAHINQPVSHTPDMTLAPLDSYRKT